MGDYENAALLYYRSIKIKEEMGNLSDSLWFMEISRCFWCTGKLW